jgi:hypothetical protein
VVRCDVKVIGYRDPNLTLRVSEEELRDLRFLSGGAWIDPKRKGPRSAYWLVEGCLVLLVVRPEEGEKNA